MRTEKGQIERRRGSGSWVADLMPIVVGSLFLSQTAFHLNLGGWNWWALFILIPTAKLWGAAWASYRATGEWSVKAREQVVGGLFPMMVAVTFLLDLDWGVVWPQFVIVAGVLALVKRQKAT